MIKKILLIMFCITLLVGTISAMTIDNIARLEGEKFIVTDNFGLGGELVQIEKVSNTLYCYSECHTIWNVTIYDDEDVFLDAIEFEDLNKKNKNLNYKFEYVSGYNDVIVDDYERVCVPEVGSKNGSIECTQQKIGSHIEKREIWSNFNPKKKLSPGNYMIKLTGYKNPKETVDWIPTFYGKRNDLWAFWIGVDPVVYWKFNGNGNNEISGRPNFVAIGSPEYVPAQLGQGINVTDNNIIEANVTNVTEDDFTMAVWFKSGEDNIWAPIVKGANDVINNNGWLFAFNPGAGSGGQVRFIVADISNNQALITSIGKYNDSVFHRAVVTFKQSTRNITIYVDGVVDNSDIIATSNFNSTWSNAPWTVGKKAGDSTFAESNVTVDDLQLFNITWTENDVVTDWNNGAGRQADISIPVNLSVPANNTFTNNASIIFNCSGTGENPLLNLSLLIQETINTTVTNTTAISNLSLQTTLNFADGNFNWTCESFDNETTQGTTVTRIFTVDTGNPSLTLTSPSGTSSYGYVGQTLFVNWSANDTNLDSCFFNYNSTNTTVTCGDGNFSFISTEQKNLTFYVNDTAGNIISSITTWDYELFENLVTFNATATETSRESFILNMTWNDTIYDSVSGNLVYNGTSYAGTLTDNGDEAILTRAIDIPLLSGNQDENKSFYWELSLTNSTATTYINTSLQNQTVSRTYLYLCNATYPTQFVNFTTHSAENPFPIINATFKVTWEWYLQSGSGTVTRNFSYEDVTETNNTFNFCMSPNNTYIVDSQIEIDSTGYSLNNYYYEDEVLNQTTTAKDLYMLNDSKATLTILKVRDSVQNPIPDVLIEIMLYDVGTNDYYTVGIAKTSFNGEDVTYLNWYDSLYRMVLVRDGSTILTTNDYKISETPQIFTIGDVFTYSWDKFQDFVYSLTYNNVTRTFLLTFTKPSGEVDTGCLRVIRRSPKNDTNICLSCESSTSATISCSIANAGNGTFIGAFYATGSYYFVDYISTNIGGSLARTIYDALGIEDSTAYAFFLSGVITMMFLVSPVMGILGVILGIIASSALGFKLLDYTIFMGVVVIGGGIIWLLKR